MLTRKTNEQDIIIALETFFKFLKSLDERHIDYFKYDIIHESSCVPIDGMLKKIPNGWVDIEIMGRFYIKGNDQSGLHDRSDSNSDE